MTEITDRTDVIIRELHNLVVNVRSDYHMEERARLSKLNNREAYLESVIACYKSMIEHYEELTQNLSAALRKSGTNHD